MSEILKRLKNPSTIVAVASLVLGILTNVGVKVDNEAIMVVINSVCGIGVALGILNDPSTKGIDDALKLTKK